MKSDEQRLGVEDAHKHLLSIVRRLPTDHRNFGDVDIAEVDVFGDCCSCRFYLRLAGELNSDWGVCVNVKSPRCGLMTFEHQAGYQCYEAEPEKEPTNMWRDIRSLVFGSTSTASSVTLPDELVPGTSEHCWSILKRLPTDYADYGGDVERWADDDLDYGDCSSCRYALPLDGKLSGDWDVCANARGPRVGLLTWEHQAGFGCYEYDAD